MSSREAPLASDHAAAKGPTAEVYGDSKEITHDSAAQLFGVAEDLEPSLTEDVELLVSAADGVDNTTTRPTSPPSPDEEIHTPEAVLTASARSDVTPSVPLTMPIGTPETSAIPAPTSGLFRPATTPTLNLPDEAAADTAHLTAVKNSTEPTDADGSKQPFTLRERTGIALAVLALVLQWSVLAVPFSDLDTSDKLWLAGGLTVAGELAFWLGVLVAGRDFVRRYRDRISIKKLIAWITDSKPTA